MTQFSSEKKLINGFFGFAHGCPRETAMRPGGEVQQPGAVLHRHSPQRGSHGQGQRHGASAQRVRCARFFRRKKNRPCVFLLFLFPPLPPFFLEGGGGGPFLGLV